MFTGGCHRSWCWWNKVLFPPDCIELYDKIKWESIEFFVFASIFREEAKMFGCELEIPTETVVY
jgi:hypothetical protein